MPVKGGHHTLESRALMSDAHKKQIITPETRAKISAALRGRPVSPERREKLSLALTGHVKSESAKANIAIAQKRRYETTDLKKFLCRRGTKLTPEHRRRISESERGEKNPRWKGGISFEPYCPKFDKDLRRRIRAFFEYRCIACGKHTTENLSCKGNIWQLSCHHVEYNKQACCDGKTVHFAALCLKCHALTNNDRERWEAMLNRAIDEIWEGRSYFTKDEWGSK
jgi:hypothetical protein